MKNLTFSLDTTRRGWACGLLAILLPICLATLAGCGRLGMEPDGDNASASGDSRDDRTAILVDGESISVTELDEIMKDAYLEDLMRKPEPEIFEARERAMREYVQRRVIEAEAEARGITPEQLFEEIVEAAPQPSIEDVTNWYAANQDRLQGARLEEVSGQIQQLLSNEAQGEAWKNFLTPKLEALDVEFVLERPRQEIAATRLIRGNENAIVTITTFSDYQCPYCIRSEPVLAEVLSRYPEEVRVVHRHFPLDSIHPFARPAAEAAMCAEEQESFWEFHDAIFARAGKLEADSFSKIANELELDVAALETCMNERRYAAFVQEDFEAGRAAGVTGTPAFFVNGIALKGARDADELSEVIDAELARSQTN
jgi:predicted DsbA family dithiol-disulfide isomerase